MPETPLSLGRSIVLALVVFLGGACVMAVELVGTRVLAPYVGSSVQVWTAIISVVLGSLSVGYMIGGRLADRYHSLPLLSGILFSSALSVLSIKFLEQALIPALMPIIADVRILATVLSFFLFALPSILLGMISPYVFRLSVKTLELSGSLAGNLTAISTTGSIVGTVATGFYLLGVMGHGSILVFVAIVLFLCGVAIWMMERKSLQLFLFVGLIVLISITSSIATVSHSQVVDIDTPYQRVFIREGAEPMTHRIVRMLVTDREGIQSAMYLDNPDELVVDYLKTFRIADVFVPRPKRALLIGGAGYSYPRYFLSAYPDSYLDVVEIDPGMTAIARRWFLVPDSSKLAIHHADGRIFLTQSPYVYDAIYMDAFGQMITPPYHLLTREAFMLMKDHLKEHGVLVVNLISAISGPRQRLLASTYKTITSVFPEVQVYTVSPEQDPSEIQNLVMVGLLNDQAGPHLDSPYAPLLTQRIDYVPLEHIDMLTDEFAPVEYYAMDLIEP